MQLQLDRRYQAVVDFIADASSGSVPEPLQAHLYRFGTVLICGYMERCVEIIIMERLKHRAQPLVLNFIKSHFKRGRNMDTNAVGELLNRFDSGWYREFDRMVQANAQLKEGVSSCYAIRNTVAHGGTTSVTLKRLQELLAAARSMIDAAVKASE